MKRIEQPIRREDLAGLSSLVFGGMTFIAATFAVWSLTAGLHITKDFAVSRGLFSNWIVWAGLAVAVRVLGRYLVQEMAEHEYSAVPVRVVMMPSRDTQIPPNDETAAAA